MYCSACGAELYSHHGACSSCGHHEASRAAVTPGAISTEASVSLPSYAEITALPIDLPIAELLEEAWGRARIGTLVHITGVLMLVVLGILAQPFGLLLVPPLAAGPHILALRALRGDPVRTKHAFAGFKQFLPLLGVGLIQGFVVICGAAPPAGIAAAVAFGLGLQGPPGPGSSLPFVELVVSFSLAFAVGLAVFGLFACFFAMFFSWSTWLVLDREESVTNAIRASVRVVSTHRVPMLKLGLALLALNAIGFLAFWIGVLFTGSFSFIVLGCAYERFFGIAGGATRLSA